MRFLSTRLATVLLVGLITLFSAHLFDRWLRDARVDLTQDDLYSLSEGSERILDRMSEEGVEPVDITLYFSETSGKTLPRFIKDFISYDRYLRSLLRQYERASDGKIRVDFVDPVTDSDEAQTATDAGLDGKLINEEGDRFFFGLTFETQTGSREAIEFLWPQEQENVEYEISKTLTRLLWPSRQRVGVLSSLEVFGSADDPFMAQMMAAQGRQPTQEWISVQLLREVYDVSKIQADAEEISNEEYDALVVIHPKNLGKKTLFAIDQYVQRGGRALVFVDPYAIDDQAPQNPQQPWSALQYQPASDLDPLLEVWGLERPADTFASDLSLAVRRPLGNGAAESLVVDLEMGPEDLETTASADSPIFQGLNDLRLLLPGVLRPIGASGSGQETDGEGEEGADDQADEDEVADSGDAPEAPEGVEIERLLATTEDGGTVVVRPGFGGQGELGYTDFNQPAKLRDAMIAAGDRVGLAYLVRGLLPSAYPEGVDYPSKEPERPPGLPPGIELPPPEDAEMLHKDPLPEEERAESAVLVFADVDFISDQVAFLQNPFGIVQAANDNHRVLLNSIDYLLGSEELMMVRSKRPLRRPFLLFDEIEAEAEMETLERERQIRADIEAFQEELRDKQSAITARNAALFEKRLQDEVDEVNEKILAANQELREIRRERRSALEAQETFVRFSVIGLMPLLVLALGVWRAVKRAQARRASSARVATRTATTTPETTGA